MCTYSSPFIYPFRLFAFRARLRLLIYGIHQRSFPVRYYLHRSGIISFTLCHLVQRHRLKIVRYNHEISRGDLRRKSDSNPEFILIKDAMMKTRKHSQRGLHSRVRLCKSNRSILLDIRTIIYREHIAKLKLLPSDLWLLMNYQVEPRQAETRRDSRIPEMERKNTKTGAWKCVLSGRGVAQMRIEFALGLASVQRGGNKEGR